MNITGISLWGDSIGKGVMYDAQRGRYAIYGDNLFSLLKKSLDIPVDNYAVMGCTAPVGEERMKRAELREGSLAVIEFGGNDCDYDWKAISADPDGEHLPHTPSERFIDGYCTAIRKARQAGARVAMTSLPPLEQSRYFSFITKGLSAENILRWLGDTDHLYRWQEYYNDMVTQLSRAFGCRLVDLRAEFLKSRVFPSLIGADGIHPTQAGHDLIHQSVQTALSY